MAEGAANPRNSGWKRHLPTRESLEANRWMRPFAQRLASPLIWRFNRRGVARGAALGLFFGICIPFVQTPVAALFAVTARANLPVAALATFVTNPFTTPFIFYAALITGRAVLQVKADASAAVGMMKTAWFERALDWLAAAAGPTLLGLMIFAVITAFAGYFAVHLGWRIWVIRRRRRRLRDRAARVAL
jgi:uncharacterized protein